jgi:hypothetical protein
MTDEPEAVGIPAYSNTFESVQVPQEVRYHCTKCGWEGPSGFSMQWWEYEKPEATIEFFCCPKCYIDWLQQNIPNTLVASQEG